MVNTRHLFILLTLISNFTIAQLLPEIKWIKSYSGGSGRDRVNKTIIDKDFNIYQVGLSGGSFTILKYSNDDGPLSYIRLLPEENAISEAKSIAVDLTGNLYVCGTNRILGSSKQKGLFYKLSSSFDELWHKEYANYSDATHLVLDGNGYPIIGIEFENSVMISKYSNEGDSIWTYEVKNDTSIYAINSMAFDTMENLYVSITREYWESGDLPEQDDIFLKINPNGEVTWQQGFRFDEIVFDKNNNILAYRRGERQLNKIDIDGELLWEYEAIGLVTDLTVDSNNDIIITGYTGGASSIDFVISKISASGSKVWEIVNNWPENRDDFMNSVTIDNLNNIYVTGSAHDMFSDDITYILKYSQDGEQLWEFKYDAPHSTFQHLNEIFTDDSSNVFVAGEITDSTTGDNYHALKIRQVLRSGIDNKIELTMQFSLSQNYPNPFNPSTKIKYSIPNAGNENFHSVQLKVYDILGREVATLVNKKQGAGNYEVQFNASSLTSGIYFYKLQSGNFVESKKMVLLQ